MGWKVRIRRPGLAAGVAGSHSVFRLRSVHPESDLYDKCDRKPEPRDPKINQDPRLVPDRRRRHEVDLSGDLQLRKRKAQYAGMVCSPKSVRHNVRRALRRLGICDWMGRVRYTDFQALRL